MSFVTDELIRSQEMYRANAIVEVAQRNGLNVPKTLREYGVSSRIIKDLGLEVAEYTPKAKKMSKEETMLNWVKENIGTQVKGGRELAEFTGVSYDTANNFIQSRKDIFSKVSHGLYLVKDAEKERNEAK